MSLQITPLVSVGVEISGFDINDAITESLKSELRSLWYQYGILLFRDQDITPEKQIEFSRIFGRNILQVYRELGKYNVEAARGSRPIQCPL